LKFAATTAKCVGRVRRITISASLFVAVSITTNAPANTKVAGTLAPEDLETPAAAAVRKLPKDVVNAPKPKRFSLEAKRDEDMAAARGVEEIIVRGQRDPEDVVTKRPPMLAFRQQLERDKPITPKQIAQGALCLIGLCSADYGPEGIPVENTAYTKGEKGAKKTLLEQGLQFRGTYQ
jgi:hypothetical protein